MSTDDRGVKRPFEVSSNNDPGKYKWSRVPMVLNDPHLCDIRIQCGDTVFLCSRGMLASSEFFYTLLHSDFDENKNGRIEISPNNIQAEQLQVFLSYLHCHHVAMKDRSMTKLIDLYTVTHMFGEVSWLELLTKEMLAQVQKSTEDEIQFWNFAVKYDYTQMRARLPKVPILCQLSFPIFTHVLKLMPKESETEKFDRLILVMEWTAIAGILHLEEDKTIRDFLQAQIANKTLEIPRFQYRGELRRIADYAPCLTLHGLIISIMEANLDLPSYGNTILDKLPTYEQLRDEVEAWSKSKKETSS